MLLLHFTNLDNKNNERLIRLLLPPTGDLFTLAKLQMALGGY